MSVSSVGIGSGVLTSDLIDKLVAAEREPTEKRLDAKKEEVTTELSVFGQIQSAVTDFRLASRPLSSGDLFQTLGFSSSNSAVAGRVSSGAQTGSYTLEVSELAKAQSLTSGVIADASETEIGSGSLTLSLGATSTTLDFDASNNSLQDIAAAINKQTDVAVSASVVNVGSGFRLVLTGDETGAENTIEITVNDSDGDNADATGLSQLAYTTGANNLNETQAATDAAFKFNGLDITRSKNSFDDVIEGVAFTLSGTNVGSPAIIEVERNTDVVVEKVQEFIDKFNALEKVISDNTNFNPDNPAASGLLLGDTSTRNIINSVRDVMGRAITGLENASVRGLAELGVKTNKDTGQLEFNSSVLVDKLKADPESVAGVFSEQGRTTDAQISYTRSSPDTKPGTYDVTVSRLATRAAFVGTAALGATTTINDDNNNFSLTIDGTSTGTVTLTAGDYTPEQLAEEFQTQINASADLRKAGKSVAVSVDANNQLVISSQSYGSRSSVSFNSFDADAATLFGFDKTYESAFALADGIEIGKDNKELTVSVDGVTSGTITLTEGTYSAADFAAEVQNRINADAKLADKGATVSVSLNADNKLEIRSDNAGDESDFSIVDVDKTTLKDLGLYEGAGRQGANVAGTINGIEAEGDGQYLVGAAPEENGRPVKNDALGLRIQISGGALGERGSVSYIEGIGEQMVDLVNNMLGSNGVITAKNERLNKELEFIAQERVSMEQRVQSLNARLVKQFTSADILVARLNSTQDFISAQLDAIVSSNKKK